MFNGRVENIEKLIVKATGIIESWRKEPNGVLWIIEDYKRQIAEARKKRQTAHARELESTLDAFRRFAKANPNLKAELVELDKTFGDIQAALHVLDIRTAAGNGKRQTNFEVLFDDFNGLVTNYTKVSDELITAQVAEQADFDALKASSGAAGKVIEGKRLEMEDPGARRAAVKRHVISTTASVLGAITLVSGAAVLSNQLTNKANQAEINRLITELERSEIIIQGLNDQIAYLQAIIDANPNAAENAKLREEIKKLQEEKDALEQKVDSLRDECLRLAEEIATKESEILEKNNKIQELENRIEDLENALANADPNTPDAQIKALQDQIAKLKTERDAARKERDDAKAERDAAQAELAKMADKYNELNNKYQAVLTENKNLKSKNAELAAQVSQLAGEKSTLERSVADLNKLVEQLKKDLRAEKDKNNKNQKTIESLEEKLEAAEKALAQAESKLAEKTKAYNTLKTNYDKVVDENKSMKAGIDNIYSKYYVGGENLSYEEKLEKISQYLEYAKADLEAKNNFNTRVKIIDILCEYIGRYGSLEDFLQAKAKNLTQEEINQICAKYGNNLEAYLNDCNNDVICGYIDSVLGINEPGNGGSGKVREDEGGNNYEQPGQNENNYEDEDGTRTGNGKVREP